MTQLQYVLTQGRRGQGIALNLTLMKNMDNTSSLCQGDQPVNVHVNSQLFNGLFLRLWP